jgi:hypothetical protein
VAKGDDGTMLWSDEFAGVEAKAVGIAPQGSRYTLLK